MVKDKELTVAVLSQTETLLGFLNPDEIEIEEGFELYKIRTLNITHPLMDEFSTDDDKYSNILLPGNKLWRTLTCDGVPCLYVILDEPSIDYESKTIKVYAEEIATELSQCEVFRSETFSWTVNTNFITTYFGNYFDEGTLSGPGTTTATSYTGALTPMEILRKIEEKRGGEFQFRYEYVNGVIKRYIDYLTSIGETHTEKIELSHNALSLDLSIYENGTRIGAAPVGTPDNDEDDFHKNLKAFEDLEVDIDVQIPLFVTQDENGDPLNGPNTYPPFNKAVGDNFVECDNLTEIVANYNYIHEKEGSSNSTPRLYTFTTSETNAINIFWECVDYIRQFLEPEINIECKVVDLQKLQANPPEYYNTGDVVYLEIPIYGTVEARIISTTKDPRRLDSDVVKVGNYQTTFLGSNYKSAGMIDL